MLGLGIASYANPSPIFVFVYISLNVLIPGQQHPAKKMKASKEFSVTLCMCLFLKGSAAPLVVGVCLAE